MNPLIPDKLYILAPLNQLVESVMFFKNSSSTQHQQQTISALPEGMFELVIQRGQGVWQKDLHQRDWTQRNDCFIGGLHHHSFQIRLAPQTEITSVRFRPGAFKHVYDGPLHELANGKVPVTDLWGSDGQQLLHQARQQSSDKGLLGVIGSFLTARLHHRKASGIDAVVRCILQEQGRTHIKDLLSLAHLSEAQFRKRFREEVGLSAKQFSRIIRIRSVVDALHQGWRQSLAELAQVHDYFDQAHFIKDFRQVTGVTPTQWLHRLS